MPKNEEQPMNERVQVLVEWLESLDVERLENWIIMFAKDANATRKLMIDDKEDLLTIEGIHEALVIALAPHITLEYLTERIVKQQSTLKRWEAEVSILLEATRHAKK